MTGRVALLAVAVTLLARGHALPQGATPDSAQKIGSSCSGPEDCNRIDNAECNRTLSTCQCPKSHPIQTSDSCLTVAGVGQNCTVSAQCRPHATNAECAAGECVCLRKYYKHKYADGVTRCLPTTERSKEIRQTPVDPVMIGILVTLVVMFLLICIALQLFSKARFRQNRTILNSANPRLMNASFLKGQPESRPRRSSRGSLQTPPGDQEKTAADAADTPETSSRTD